MLMLLQLQLLLLLAINGAPGAKAEHPETSVQETMATGQQLADACASYQRRNADTTLLVPANTTLRLANATFTSVPDAEAADGKAFSSGTLTIQGAGSQTSVIDAGMRAGERGGRGVQTTFSQSKEQRAHQRRRNAMLLLTNVQACSRHGPPAAPPSWCSATSPSSTRARRMCCAATA